MKNIENSQQSKTNREGNESSLLVKSAELAAMLLPQTLPAAIAFKQMRDFSKGPDSANKVLPELSLIESDLNDANGKGSDVNRTESSPEDKTPISESPTSELLTAPDAPKEGEGGGNGGKSGVNPEEQPALRQQEAY